MGPFNTTCGISFQKQGRRTLMINKPKYQLAVTIVMLIVEKSSYENTWILAMILIFHDL